MMRTRFWLLIGIITLLSVQTFAQERTAKEVADAYQQNANELAAHYGDGFLMDRSADTLSLIRERSSLVAEWAAVALNRSGNVSVADVNKVVTGLDPKLNSDVLQLDPNTFVVEVETEPSAEIPALLFAINKHDRFSIAWTAPDWSPPAYDVEKWRPFSVGALTLLPTDSGGYSRFLVEATYSQDAGLTMGTQLSIWKWDGATVASLYSTTYAFYIDSAAQGLKIDGDLLRVTRKGEFKTMFCESCPDPEEVSTLKLTPTGVEDLGVVRKEPALDLIDELFARLSERKPATDLAALNVIAEIRKAMAEWEAILEDPDGSTPDSDHPKFGTMLMDWAIRKENDRSILCVETDDLGRNLFSIEIRNGKPFIGDIRHLGDFQIDSDWNCKDVLHGNGSNGGR